MAKVDRGLQKKTIRSDQFLLFSCWVFGWCTWYAPTVKGGKCTANRGFFFPEKSFTFTLCHRHPPKKSECTGGESFEIGSEKCTTPRLIQVAVLFFPLPPPKRGKEGRKRPLRTEKLFPLALSVHLFPAAGGGRRWRQQKEEKEETFFIRPEAKKGASFSTIRVMEGYTVDRDYHFIDRSK